MVSGCVPGSEGRQAGSGWKKQYELELLTDPHGLFNQIHS